MHEPILLKLTPKTNLQINFEQLCCPTFKLLFTIKERALTFTVLIGQAGSKL